MISAAVIYLLTLTGPDNQIVQINPSTIVSIKSPRGKDHFPPGVKCLINTTDGKFHTVMESCEEVQSKIEALTGGE